MNLRGNDFFNILLFVPCVLTSFFLSKNRRRVELLKRLAKWMFVFKNNLFFYQRFTAELPSSLSISDKDFLSRIECMYLGIFNRQRISARRSKLFYCPLLKLGLKLFKWQQLAYHCQLSIYATCLSWLLSSFKIWISVLVFNICIPFITNIWLSFF